MCRGVLLLSTAIPQVFDECYVFTIAAVLNTFCTYVDKQEEPMVKNIEMFEYGEFTVKFTHKVNKEVNNSKEEAVNKYEMNFLSGLKVWLKAVGSYNPPQREVGAQHNLKSKMTKLKMTKGYKNCCCPSHCVLSEHRKTVGTLDLNVELSKEFMFPDLLDRAWDEFEDYKVEMFDALPMVQDKLL